MRHQALSQTPSSERIEQCKKPPVLGGFGMLSRWVLQRRLSGSLWQLH